MSTLTKTGPSTNPLAAFLRDPLWQRLAKRKSALVGLAIVLFMVFVAVFAPLLAPYDPTAQSWTAVRKAPLPRIGSAPTKPGATSSPALSGAPAPR